MAPFDRLHTSSYWHSMLNMVLSCIISKTKRDIGRKMQFFIPPALNAPIRKVTVRIVPYYLVWKNQNGVIVLPLSSERVSVS